MESLKEKFLGIANEYARQFGEVIGYSREFWAGIVEGQSACFGDNYFFTLAEMQMVVDDLPKWVEAYGSKSAVGEEVCAWFDWVVDPDVPTLARLSRGGVPRINLAAWLRGLRPC